MGRREGRAADEVLRCWAQAGLCVGRGASPVGEEVLTPPGKKEAPLGTPLFSPAAGAAPVHRPVHFAVVFDHSLREPRPADVTAKEGLGVKASDEQRVDKLQGVTRRRGPKLRPDDCGDGDGPAPPFRTIQARQQVPRFPRLQAPQEAPCGSAPTYGVMDLTDGAAFGKLIFLASSKAKSITVSRVSAGRTSNK
jgi:hypothetical protein